MADDSLTLNGCAPTPLASYLKALGVLRLISSPDNHVSGEAADRQARGWWENECFHLRTTLSRDDLLRFFLQDYAPSPIIAPWNGRAGFLEGDESETSSRAGAVLMNEIGASTCRRLESMRRTVNSLRKNAHLYKFNHLRAKVKLLQQKSKKLEGDAKKTNDAEKHRVEKEVKAVKSLLLPSLRSETESQHVSYIDACYVLAADEATAPILGSGGNEGSFDFGVNFAKRLRALIDFENGKPTARAGAELESAVFSSSYCTDARGSMALFSPGQGGPNATTGFVGENPLNAWNVVLAMEGTMAFAGALTRRSGAAGGSRGRAAFPFTFDPTDAGTGNLSSEDPSRPRAEIWTPLWSKPATLSEIGAIFAEGRLTVGRRMARTGLDAARAVAQLGVARGIGSFERYSMIQSDGNMHQATPLGRFAAPERPRRDLIVDLEAGDWLESMRKLAGRKTSPARARQALRRLEDSLFQMTSANRAPEGTRRALVALGGLVAWLATNPSARKNCKPPPVISCDWLRQADDGSAEFRIAAALAGIGLPVSVHPASAAPMPAANGGSESATTSAPPVSETLPGETTQAPTHAAPPMAAHFAPLALDKQSFFYKGRLSTRRAWADDAPPTVVWGAGALVPNMIAVLERRLVEASIRGLESKPLASAAPARLSDVAAFLSGDFDDARCAALLAGLVWARPAHLRSTPASDDRSSVPFAYAALKPVYTPDAVLQGAGALPQGARMPVPPGLVARLRAGGNSRDGRTTDPAVRAALARARASGLATPFDVGRSGARRSAVEGGRVGAGVAADRLAAALLIPVDNWALAAMLRRAYPGALSE